MNKRISEREWLEDFQDFVDSEGASVPENLSKSVFARVRRDLNPSPWLVFAKLLGIHAVVGTLSLALCNQFGMSPFHSGLSLSGYFMKFGHSACMVLCGVLFVGLSILLCRPILRNEELFVLRKNAPLQIFGLSTISLALFLALGAEILLVVGLLWIAGAMLGGLLAVFSLPRRSARTG